MFVFAEWSHQLQPMGLVHIIGIVSASSLYNRLHHLLFFGSSGFIYGILTAIGIIREKRNIK